MRTSPAQLCAKARLRAHLEADAQVFLPWSATAEPRRGSAAKKVGLSASRRLFPRTGRPRPGACSSVVLCGAPSALRSAGRPNPSLKLTRYGRLCKPGLRYSIYFLSPGLQSLPSRAA